MPTIDLDAAKAARREAKQEAPVVTFAGKSFTLPVELPFDVVRKSAVAADEQRAEMILSALFGESQWEKFLELEPSMSDVNELFDGITAAYGLAVGNSSASTRSSKTTSRR